MLFTLEISLCRRVLGRGRVGERFKYAANRSQLLMWLSLRVRV